MSWREFPAARPSIQTAPRKWMTSSSKLRLSFVTSTRSVTGPANFVSNGKWHKIKVTVHPPRGLPRLFVRSREGYYAIANPK